MLLFAEHVGANFSKDPRTKVGCVIASSDMTSIISTGWNSMPDDVDGSTDRWEREKKENWVVHAEVNAICKAAKNGIRLQDTVCFVSLFPCSQCCKFLIQAGIKKLIAPKPDLLNVRWGANWALAIDLLKEARIGLEYSMI